MQGFDYRELLFKFRYPLLILLVGLVLAGAGFFFYKSSGLADSGTKVEILNATESAVLGVTTSNQTITVEIAGQVVTPGVYKLPNGSRVDDLLVVSGGFSAKADRSWSSKYLNRASKISDGQKIYIPASGESFDSAQDKQSVTTTANTNGVVQSGSSINLTDSSGSIIINTASGAELDKLPGIGPVYAQSIIEHRPYSTTQELVSKGAIKQSLYDKIKNLISVY